MSYNFLLVDDSNIVRKSLKKTLGMTDLDVGEVYEAGNGKEGLDVLKDNWVDLVFLDINMPVMNGIEFMERLRADEELKNTPVVIVSTEGSKERQEQLLAMQVKDYLRKPTTPEDIVECVHNLLGNSNE